MEEKFLEIRSYDGPGYQPLVDFGAWRAAVLNDDPQKYRPETLNQAERHLETDELFILAAGRCTLLIGDAEGDMPGPGTLRPVVMEPGKFYNIKKGVWHNLLTEEETRIIIVENADTTRDNSEYCAVTPDMLP
ncbi:MAG: hypothetical protein IJM76_07325 [Lachnospiraceae bacterium]|nr:hypothetical protein [Lachnospiraceae bacterium]